MKSITLQVNNEEGLHARPAMDFSQMASTFASDIWLEKDDVKADAKSMLMVLSACIYKGESFLLSADGEDEEAAIQALADLVNNLRD